MNIFNKPQNATVVTGATSSVTAVADAIVGNDSVPAAVTSGYLSYGMPSIEVKGIKILGIDTDQGFLYPASLGEEVMAELKSFADRGFAYEFGADS
jgi:hypothetical protein